MCQEMSINWQYSPKGNQKRSKNTANMPTDMPTQVPTDSPTDMPTEPLSDFHRRIETGYKTLQFDYKTATNWVAKGCDFVVILS